MNGHFDIAFFVAQEKRPLRSNAQVGKRLKRQTGKGLAADASGIGVVGADVDSIELRLEGAQQTLQLIVNATQIEGLDQSPADTGLVGHQYKQETGLSEAGERLGNSGVQLKISRIVDISGVGVERPVSIKKDGAMLD
jgi:hypothetical protein